MTLLESNFENWLSFVGESCLFLHNKELSYVQPNGSPILALFFSQCRFHNGSLKAAQEFVFTFKDIIILLPIPVPKIEI